MKNGAEVRTLDELKENFDLESVLGYFTDGKLATWLADRYYDEKAEAVSALSADTPELNAKLCEILEVEYQGDNDDTDIEYIQRRNEKYKVLSAFTDNKSILNNIDIVAMDQDELYDILDESPEKVYLYGDKFEIPFGRKNVQYIGINKPIVIIDKNKYANDFEEAGITFSNVIFEEGALKIRYPDPIGEFEIENGVLKKGVPNSEGVCIIPYGVTSIGNSAFYGCKELLSVTIPDSIISIEKDAFCHCKNLLSVIILGGVSCIENYAFFGCDNLTNIVLPEGVTEIGKNAFGECESLKSIIIPESVEIIQECAFAKSGLEAISIPSKVKVIEQNAFLECRALKSVKMSYGLEIIDNQAFWNCSNLETVIIPDSVTTISSHAFCSCEKLVSITIPKSVTHLGNCAFADCKSLSSVTILGNFTTYDDKTAFYRTPWGERNGYTPPQRKKSFWDRF